MGENTNFSHSVKNTDENLCGARTQDRMYWERAKESLAVMKKPCSLIVVMISYLYTSITSHQMDFKWSQFIVLKYWNKVDCF